MTIDGKHIADEILQRLIKNVATLQQSNVAPTMAVILVGDDPASLAYIKQKQKAAQKIGAQVIFDHQPSTISPSDLASLVNRYNSDPLVHGLIIQRPIPQSVGDVSHILTTIDRNKDVDGFLPDSPFDVPVAAAVGEILRTVYNSQSTINNTTKPDENEFLFWLKEKHIVVIGRGETAGEPIYRYFQKLDCTTSQIHSKTPNPEKIIRDGDIVISCVGKEHVVIRESTKPGAILISVGIRRDQEGKLRGDYDESDIANQAYAYTPTPGGVGPVNVACLMKNLIKSCTMYKGGIV